MECKFYVGQKVVCIKRGLWFSIQRKEYHHNGPSYGDVVTIEMIVERQNPKFGLVFAEFKNFYDFRQFRPLHDTTDTVKALTAITADTKIPNDPDPNPVKREKVRS